MAKNHAERDPHRERTIRYFENVDPDFQKRWMSARHLTGEQVDAAFRHGLFAGGRFAERTFDEISGYLEESWRGMKMDADWRDVSDIVRSGYDLAEGGAPEDGPETESAAEALDHFPTRTSGGSATGGTMGERSGPGNAGPETGFEGEGGPPVGGHEDAR